MIDPISARAFSTGAVGIRGAKFARNLVIAILAVAVSHSELRASVIIAPRCRKRSRFERALLIATGLTT